MDISVWRLAKQSARPPKTVHSRNAGQSCTRCKPNSQTGQSDSQTVRQTVRDRRSTRGTRDSLAPAASQTAR
eukprot:2144354-Pyramimonas_sp.AAC.1